MALRAYWKGYLKLSLVSCPIAVYPATSEREKISFNQLNKATGHRIRYRKVDAETGEDVPSDQIIKGNEVAKGEYVEVQPEELEAVAIESKRTIDIEEFVPKSQIDECTSEIPITLPLMAMLASRLSRSFEKPFAKKVWSPSARWFSLPVSTSSHWKPATRVCSGSPFAIRTRFGSKQTILMRSPTRRSQRTCSTWPFTSSIPSEVILIPNISRTNTRMPSRS